MTVLSVLEEGCHGLAPVVDAVGEIAGIASLVDVDIGTDG